MTRIYLPYRPRGYLSPLAVCEQCAELRADNHELRVQVEALSLTLDVLRKAVLADYEFRGFPDAEDYINDLVIEQVKREAENAREWPC